MALQPGMGISDLQTLKESDPVLCKAGVCTVDMVKTAWTGGGGGLGAPLLTGVGWGELPRQAVWRVLQ